MVRFQFPATSKSETAIIELKFNYPQFKKVIFKWFLKHGGTIIPVVASVGSGVIGGSLHFISANILSPIAYQGPLLPVILRGPPRVQARNVGIFYGVFAGLGAIMVKDNVHNIAVSGFCAGFVSALAAGAKGSTAFSNGLLWALMYGGARKVQEELSGPPRHIDLHKKKTQRESIEDSSLSLHGHGDIQLVKDSNGPRQIDVDHTQREEVEVGSQRNQNGAPDIHHYYQNNNIQRGESIFNSPLPLLSNSGLQEEVKSDHNGDEQYTNQPERGDMDVEIGGPTNEI